MNLQALWKLVEEMKEEANHAASQKGIHNEVANSSLELAYRDMARRLEVLLPDLPEKDE